MTRLPVAELHLRSKSLSSKSEQGGSKYIDEAINLDRQALELCPPDHHQRPISLMWLAIHLSHRYNQLGVMADLDEAIDLDRDALSLHLHGHPHRLMSLNNLANRLSARYRQLGALQDLDEAIVLDQEALTLCPQGHPHRSMSLNKLAVRFYTRYNQHGGIQDLDEAIVLDQEALDLRPQGHPHRLLSLNYLANCLSARYNQHGAMHDLDEAIILNREALSLRPQGHPGRSMSLANLGIDLSIRYKHRGAMQDLDEAIILDRETLSLRPQGHPHRSSSLNNLANCLFTRCNQLGAVQDLDEAIVLDREALKLCPQGHRDHAILLNNLAIFLSSRYKQLGAVQDLNEAIALAREALSLFPQGQPNRSSSLSSLALHLSFRYNHLGTMQDLDEAIVLDRGALTLRPQGHPRRSMSLNNIAIRHSIRYNQLGVMRDLDEAILFGREAFTLRPPGHPNRSKSLVNLTRYLHNRFIRSKQLQDQEEVFSLFAQLEHVTQTVSSSDLAAARAWIDAAEHFQHPTLLLAYETAHRLLVRHLAILPSLPQHLVTLKRLTSSLAVDAFSACLYNNAPAHAVELLEQGRGVFWSQLTRLQSPLEDVCVSGTVGKMLANEFTQLTSLIRNTINSSESDQHERMYHLNFELQRVVANIRELPGLSRFLLPSLFPDLQCAASGGPVIIVNASECSCDVLVVLLDRDPVHIPLWITQEHVEELSTELRSLTVRATRSDITRELAFFLRRLWDQVVSPIVDFLQTIHPLESRIWWCPTGEFTSLPLHAAGPYRKGQHNLPDLYISSYTPTLTALIRARHRDPPGFVADRKRFIAIGQANAVGETELLSVGAELDKIGQCVEGLATFLRIDGEASTISRVVEELGNTEWVHLACHGIPNRTQPFESAFALHDGYFTIQRIIGCDLKNPEFAYLSACHTTVGDEESPDEVIHLASAMQFLGFRSVIGTMWAVDDGETNKMTSTFYKHMVDELGCLDYTRAAFALNKTMKTVNIPFDQRVLYIHLGA